MEDQNESLNVIINKWYTQSNKIIESVTPPLEGIKIPHSNEVLNASPFKKKHDRPLSTPINRDLDRIVEQNNYTNQVLHTISQQIEGTKNSVLSFSPPAPEKGASNPNPITNPIFKIPEFQKDKFPNLSDEFKVSGKILEHINDKLSKFKISEKAESSNSKGESNSQKNSLSKLTSDRFSTKKNYYKKPSPPDVQFEENPYLSTSNHDGRGITEWNVDGLAEHQIYNKLHEMGVAITAYKIRGATDKEAATMIVSGFTGMIKHWWDNYFTDDVKNLIYGATAVETIVKTENGQVVLEQVAKEDACATLLYHIARHFIGEPKLFQDRSLEILNNLTCKDLADFRWYKDTFLVKVMIRPDCNNDFWKERFISGLPSLFAEKVRTKIKDRFEGKIPYDILTYGDLISFITTVGIDLCTDIKLKKQLKKDSASKYGLGTFCQDYGFTSPSQRHKKKSSKPHKKASFSKKPFKRESYKPSRKFAKRKASKAKDTCWTCGKTGHRAKDCKSSKKKKINQLDLSDEARANLFSIMEGSPESSEPSDSYTSSSDDYSDEEFINAAYETDQSQSGKECDCNSTFCTCTRKTVNVILGNPKEILFDIIEHIQDDEARNKYLLELKRLMLSQEEKPPKPVIQPFSMKQVMSRFDKPAEPSIADLKGEISTLKGEIKNLKIRLDHLELNALTDQVLKNVSLPENISPPESPKNFPVISNDHLREPEPRSFPGSDPPSTSGKAITAIKAYSEHIAVKIVINKDFVLNRVALFDTGADSNCIVKGLIPTRYLQKSTSRLYSATGEKMEIHYKLPKAHICNNGICLVNDFVITDDITEDIILGIPFVNQIRPYWSDYDGIRTTLLNRTLFFPLLRPLSQEDGSRIKEQTVLKINRLSSHVNFLKQDVQIKKIEHSLQTPEMLTKISNLHKQFEEEICSDLPNAFWERKTHLVELPYIPGFDEQTIPTKARPIQMNQEMMEICKNEINHLLEKGIIRSSNSPWSCSAFYVNNSAEKERGTPRLVINYKPLNVVLKWIRHPIPNKRDLLKRTYKANLYSKFDMKSGF
ncbi:hypothetical protein P3L10_034574 [Capsicum annuum]